MRFCVHEVFDFVSHYRELAAGAELGAEEVDAVVQAIATFAEDVLLPLNRSGDEEGASFEAGRVRSPRGFADAYRQYVDAGWPRLGNPTEYGGEAAPYSLKLSVSEFMQAANHSWCMYALLNDGAIKTLLGFADEELLRRFVPKLVSGEWMGTMCLTEAHCGSDLSQVRSRAELRPDGSYSITGTKIFISSGEQDFSENIVHLVLARLPDAAPGTRGISLFVVPKRVPDEDGVLWTRRTQCDACPSKARWVEGERHVCHGVRRCAGLAGRAARPRPECNVCIHQQVAARHGSAGTSAC